MSPRCFCLIQRGAESLVVTEAEQQQVSRRSQRALGIPEGQAGPSFSLRLGQDVANVFSHSGPECSRGLESVVITVESRAAGMTLER